MADEIDRRVRAHWQVPAYDRVYWLGRQSRYCIVIPVINEGHRLHSLLSRMNRLAVPNCADVIVVDGGSTDDSVTPQAAAFNQVRGLLVKTGVGKLGAQLRCAYAFALEQGYEGVITIDGNDKDDPEAIARFLAALDDGIDFVQASRFVAGGLAEHTPLLREFAIRLLHAPLLSHCSGFHWTDTTQGFRAYSRRLLLDPRVAVFRDIFMRYELLAYLSYRAPRLGYRCVELPTARRYPADGSVPTKLNGLRGNLDLLRALIGACTGRFNPPVGVPDRNE